MKEALNWFRLEAENTVSFLAERVHEAMNKVFDNSDSAFKKLVRVARHPKTYLVIVYFVLFLLVVFL